MKLARKWGETGDRAFTLHTTAMHQAMSRYLCACPWEIDFVVNRAAESFSEPQPDEPKDHRSERGQAQGEQNRRAAYRVRHHVLLADEKGSGRDEEGETHSPQMTGNPLSGRELRAQDCIDVEQAREQAHASEGEQWAAAHRRRRNSRETSPDGRCGRAEHKCAGDDLECAGRPVTTAGRDPGRPDEITGEHATQSQVRVLLEPGQDCGCHPENNH